MSSRMQNQLVNYKDFNPKNVTFSKPRLAVYPKISGYRIFINYKNPDGSVGDLILGLPTMYSIGIRNGSSVEDDDPNKPPKYSLPLCIYDKNGPTDEQLEVQKTFEKIGELISDHVMKIKKEVKRPKLGIHNLVKTCPMSWKLDDEGERDLAIGPKIWPQLFIDYKTRKLKTLLYDENGKDVDYDRYCGVGAMVTSCIKVNSIWIPAVVNGGNVSTKLTVYEAKMSFVQKSTMSFLGRPEPVEEEEVEEEEVEEDNNEDGDEEGSL